MNNKKKQSKASHEAFLIRSSAAEYLNISRHISTSIAESEIDLAATHRNLVKIEQEIQVATRKHNEFLKELGLPPIPHGETGKE
jgi:type I restriction enzyme M protein